MSKLTTKLLSAGLAAILGSAPLAMLPTSAAESASQSNQTEETVNYMRIKNLNGPSGVALGARAWDTTRSILPARSPATA
ncbi:MAG: hypothetical protein IJX47_04340 [Clostridia bacterium]|nr:hypothetical protein [Clostridia bacterium]